MLVCLPLCVGSATNLQPVQGLPRFCPGTAGIGSSAPATLSAEYAELRHEWTDV